MIASAAIAGLLLTAGAKVPQIFLLAGLANAAVVLYIFLLVPEYLLRFAAWAATHLVYRFRVRGEEHIPVAGPAVLVCNHVSFVDAVLLMAASPRPIYFVMDHRIFKPGEPLGLFFQPSSSEGPWCGRSGVESGNRVGLNVGAALPASQVAPAMLQTRVAQLLVQ